MIAKLSQLSAYLGQLRELDFVKHVEFDSTSKRSESEMDGILHVDTPQGKFTLLVEFKSSYLGRTHINALITHAREYAETYRAPLLILARHLPAPSAEKLADAGVNFLDRAGNIHLTLGKNYGRTIIGRRESQKAKEPRVITAAKGQLLFTFAAYEEAPSWTVRQLAEASGVSKSNVAKLRKQLVEEGVLTHTFRFRNGQQLEPQLLGAYEQALRPKLLINRFTAAEPTEQLLPKLRDSFAKSKRKWSLTGGLAAFELQRFYKGAELPIFVESFAETDLRTLRVLPDRNGPLILLRAFGTVPFWKQMRGSTIAHPWLIYSELMYSTDPRAHEAAAQLKAEFLSSD